MLRKTVLTNTQEHHWELQSFSINEGRAPHSGHLKEGEAHVYRSALPQLLK